MASLKNAIFKGGSRKTNMYGALPKKGGLDGLQIQGGGGGGLGKKGGWCF